MSSASIASALSPISLTPEALALATPEELAELHWLLETTAPAVLAPDPCPPGLTDDQRAEWLKCRDDPAYFIRSYVWIEDLDTRAWVRFVLWPGQEPVVPEFKAHRRVCI